MSAFLPYGRQHIDEDDIAAVVEALRAPLITQGPLVERFEAALGQFLGSSHVVSCATGTDALELAYRALELGPGDEIVTTPITFAATATAALRLGAEARFAEVEPDSGNLDPSSVAACIGPRTRGIVAVHLGGQPVDMAALRTIADQHGLWLVEDAAHALGAELEGSLVGGDSSLADASTFSFHPVKHITTGEGGAVTTRDTALATRLARLRHHGIERDPAAMRIKPPGPWFYEIAELAGNHRLSDLQCALGISQLAKLPAWLERRRQIARDYRELLANTCDPGLISWQRERPDRSSAYHLFIALIDFAAAGTDRATVMQALHAQGIGTQVHYVPLTQQLIFRERPASALDAARPRPGVDSYYRRALSLPMIPTMTRGDVERVCQALSQAARCSTGRAQEISP